MMRLKKKNMKNSLKIQTYKISANTFDYPSEEFLLKKEKAYDFYININQIKSICEFCKNFYLVTFIDGQYDNLFNIYVITDYDSMLKIKERLEQYYAR